MIEQSNYWVKQIRTILPIFKLRKSNFKFNLKMKLTYTCILVTMLNLQANGTYSQSSRVSLNHKNVTTESILDAIEQTTDFRFIYKIDDVNLQRLTSINIKDKQISTVLDLLFDGTSTDYKIRKSQVILKRRKGIQPTEVIQIVTESAQQIVNGNVVDQEGVPLPGATILEKGTTNGTQTDFDGNFSLNVTDENAVLVISYIGFATVEIPIEGQLDISVVLEESTAGLDEVVIVGYGTKLSSKITSAISVIDTEVLENRPLTSAQQAFNGIDPGLRISRSNGSPGSLPGINIRGQGGPLVLVDGFRASISDVDPNTIENISILKDAAASAIYGLEGSSGVILITTKSGKRSQETTFNYSVQTSIQEFTSIPALANTVQYMELKNKADLNEQIYINGVTPNEADPLALFSQEVINRAKGGEFPDTKWSDEVYAEPALQTNHSLDISGGSEKTNFFVGLGFVEQNGVNIDDSDNYQRYNLRSKINSDINSWFNLNANLAFTHRVRNTVPVDAARGIRAVPYYTLRDDDPRIGLSEPSGLLAVGDGGTSGNAILNSTNGSFGKSKRDVIELAIGGKIKITKGLTLEENAQVSIISGNNTNWTNSTSFASLEFDGQTGVYSSSGIVEAQSSNRRLRESTSRSLRFTSQTIARYNWTNDLHSFGAIVGWQIDQFDSRGFNAVRTNFLNESVISLNLGGVEVGLDNGVTAMNSDRRVAAFGRLSYDYRSIYVLDASFRFDKSGQFAPGNRSDFFPSVSGSWNVDKEEFMSNVDAISKLKLRISWGKVGDDSVQDLSFISRVNQNSGYPWPDGIEPGLAIANFANPTLTWEELTKSNIGLELGFWKGKLNITGEWFQVDRKDILRGSNVPDEFGLAAPRVNSGEQQRKGWELSISHRNRIKDLNYTIAVNFSNNVNRWTSLGGDLPSFGGSLTQEGFPVGIWYGYTTDGLIRDQVDLDAYLSNHTFDGPRADVRYVGAPKLVDISGPDGVPDGVISSEHDRTVIQDDRGIYIIGGQLRLNYKGWNLATYVNGILNREIYATGNQSENPFSGGAGNAFAVHINSFDPDNPDVNAPYPLLRSGLVNYDRSDYWNRSSSFIRVSNINLSYQFERSVLDNLVGGIVKKLNLFVSIENPLTIWDNFFASDFGWDPELGIGAISYPLARTYSFGLRLSI